MHLGKLLEHSSRGKAPKYMPELEEYEAMYGPHFNEASAMCAVEAMRNEDGSTGPHWSVEETTALANQLGVNVNSVKHNKWDWFVAMNMMYSDFYKVVVSLTGTTNTKSFAELAKAWLTDKDVKDGKTWRYFAFVVCEPAFEDDYDEADEYEYHSAPYYGMNRPVSRYGSYSGNYGSYSMPRTGRTANKPYTSIKSF